MSYIAEVLSTVQTVQISEIKTKVPELQTIIEKTKHEFLEFIDDVYVKFTQLPEQNKIQLKKVTKLRDDAHHLQEKSDELIKKQLLETDAELHDNIENLNNLCISIDNVHKICMIHEGLTLSDELLETKRFVECIQALTKVEAALNLPNIKSCSEVYKSLKEAYMVKKAMFFTTTHDVVFENIEVTEDNNGFTLKIKPESSELAEALKALFLENVIVHPLQQIVKYVWKIFETVVDHTVKFEIEENCEGFTEMKLMKISGVPTPSYIQVFKQLRTFLKFLSNTLDYCLEDDVTVLGYIGRETRDNLLELLIKRCLERTVPSTNEGLTQYQLVINDTEELEVFLKQIGIFTQDQTGILAYANNIDVLFINKRCRDYLEIAGKYMKKDLHDMVEVGTPYDLSNPFSTTNLQFSRCSISKSVLELEQLCERILQEALTASDEAAGRLLHTLQTILQIYGKIVEKTHAKLLATIPQQVAIFHNNCLYLSWKIPQWTELYLEKLPPVLKITCSLLSEESQLERTGKEALGKCVENEIGVIREILEKFGLTSGQSPDKLDITTEKSLRQCLRQQELLKTVWQKVLSYEVYNKNLGNILDSMCVFLIKTVMTFVDIRSEVAQQLEDIFKIVLTRGPKLFTEPKEVCLYVGSWYKFTELNFVLGANLADIAERWTDGKGPLGLQFQPGELRHLVMALFQNTERRAAFLEKISLGSE